MTCDDGCEGGPVCDWCGDDMDGDSSGVCRECLLDRQFVEDDPDDDDNCMNRGQCEWCIERSIAGADEGGASNG